MQQAAITLNFIDSVLLLLYSHTIGVVALFEMCMAISLCQITKHSDSELNTRVTVRELISNLYSTCMRCCILAGLSKLATGKSEMFLK